MSSKGIVYLVGGGPGDPGLITIRGRQLLQRADVVIYDRLAPVGLLGLCRQDALIIGGGKSATERGKGQDRINDLLIEHARLGRCVVRLKGGDPGVFGRVAEERSACLAHGVRCVIVPGVSSALAAPASLGIQVTQRGISRSFTVVTGRDCVNSGSSAMDFKLLAGVDTLIVLMGRRELATICRGLIDAGRSSKEAILCIERATTPQQRECRGCLDDIADRVEKMQMQAPMVIVIGKVASTPSLPPELVLPPLLGLKVVVTGTPALCTRLSEELSSRGAEAIRCPLIRIEFPPKLPALDEELQRLDEFGWLVFSSANGIRGFFKRLHALNLDARALSGCRIAAVGSRSARELLKHGLRADVIPNDETGSGLASAILEASDSQGRCVLLPRSDRGLPALTSGLRRAGMEVVDVVAYRTIAVPPSPGQVVEINDSADAILFASPSAVECAVASGIDTQGRVVACIGETTSDAAQRMG
ncbi:MAG: uroporphyrinogen-III C-methyltransferase, partial [Planctomycetes bacterium]|nr:uroporphyrinogen-III C-methyltransferase [Planctomycetota bacterium]